MRSLQVDGKKLRRLREKRGMTVAELAAAAGCGPSHIYKIEKHPANQPGAPVYARIKKALNAEDHDLVADAATAAEGAA